MEVSDYWLGVVLEPYRELPLGASEEACTVHNTVLKPSDQFIVVQWLRAGLQARGYTVAASGTTLRISRRAAPAGPAPAAQ